MENINARTNNNRLQVTLVVGIFTSSVCKYLVGFKEGNEEKVVKFK